MCLFHCLITPVEDLSAPQTDHDERHAHNWREPKAKQLTTKKKKFVGCV
jgi:hypothetical protein